MHCVDAFTGENVTGVDWALKIYFRTEDGKVVVEATGGSYVCDVACFIAKASRDALILCVKGGDSGIATVPASWLRRAGLPGRKGMVAVVNSETLERAVCGLLASGRADGSTWEVVRALARFWKGLCLETEVHAAVHAV